MYFGINLVLLLPKLPKIGWNYQLNVSSVRNIVAIKSDYA